MAADEQQNQDWSVVITSKRSAFALPWREMWDYRELVLLLAHRDFIAQYKQTILGSLWYVLQPLLQSLMFIFVFTKVAKIPTGEIPPLMFFFSGTLCWRYFSECVSKTANTFTASQRLFDKVYFPRMAVPVSQLLTNLVGFGMGLVLFVGFYIFFYLKGAPLEPNWRIIVFPLLVVQMAALGLGVGCLVSALTNRFRDLFVLLSFFLQLWMYASCVVYPLKVVPEEYRWIYELNPMVFVIESFRFVTMGEGTVTLPALLGSAAISFVILLIGLVFFNKMSHTSVDTA